MLEEGSKILIQLRRPFSPFLSLVSIPNKVAKIDKRTFKIKSLADSLILGKYQELSFLLLP